MKLQYFSDSEWFSLSLSSQKVYCVDEIIEMMITRVWNATTKRHHFDNIRLQYEEEIIRLLGEEDLSLACRLACTYHNSLVRQNLSSQIGLDNTSYGYGPDYRPPIEYVEQLYNAGSHVEDVCEVSAESSGDESWDEEEKGDRVVFDAHFETNET